MRIKALQEIYAYHQSGSSDLARAERHLLESVDNLFELFVYQLSFLVEVKHFAERRIEENRKKHFPTEEDLNPNLKFVNNRILNVLDNNRNLLFLEEKYKINWADFREDFIRNCYNKITETSDYQNYMNNGIDSFDDDKQFLASLVDNYMADDTLLYDFYADRKLSFNSDYPLAVFSLWKFFSDLPASFDENTKLSLPYKSDNESDADDKEFVVKLFEKTLLHADEYREMVEDNISNWDYNRLALMDKILIYMAMTEFCEFHSIPVKVTINEYIELSKYFSTPESRRFVNGMLDRLSITLKEQGKLVKTGLGLMERKY